MRKVLVLLIVGLFTALSANAAYFSLQGVYWDTDELGDTFGGGIGFGFPIGEVFEIDLRATYLEELSDNPFDAIFNDDPIFQKTSVELLPVDLGIRFNLQRRGSVNPYFGVGGTYVFIDHEIPGVDLDDEVGFYGLFGLRFGDDQGAGFFTEALYRSIEATVTDNDLFDGFDIDDGAKIDLDGFSVNAGFRWNW